MEQYHGSFFFLFFYNFVFFSKKIDSKISPSGVKKNVGKSIEEYLQYQSFEYSFETPPHQLVQLFRGGEDSSGLVFDFDSFEVFF